MTLEDKFQFLLGGLHENITEKFEYLLSNSTGNDLQTKFEYLMKATEPESQTSKVSNANQNIQNKPIPPLAPINVDCNDPNNPDILAYVWETDYKGTRRECITANDFEIRSSK